MSSLFINKLITKTINIASSHRMHACFFLLVVVLYGQRMGLSQLTIGELVVGLGSYILGVSIRPQGSYVPPPPLPPDAGADVPELSPREADDLVDRLYKAKGMTVNPHYTGEP